MIAFSVFGAPEWLSVLIVILVVLAIIYLAKRI
jgi:hypothetical protein